MKTRMYRILMDAEAADPTGGGPAPVVETSTTRTTDTKPPAPAPVPEVVTKAEFERVWAELAKHEAAEKARQDAARKAEEDRLRKEGEYEKLLAAKEAEAAAERARVAALESMTKKTLADRELALALAGADLLPGQAGNLSKLLRDDVTVEPDGSGGWKVSAGGKSVGDFVRETLAKPEFAPFVAAKSRGGAGGQTPAHTPTPGSSDNLTYGQRVIEQWKSARSNPSGGFNPGFGFRAIAPA